MEPTAPASSLNRTNINPQQPDDTELKKAELKKMAEIQNRKAGGWS